MVGWWLTTVGEASMERYRYRIAPSPAGSERRGFCLPLPQPSLSGREGFLYSLCFDIQIKDKNFNPDKVEI